MGRAARWWELRLGDDAPEPLVIEGMGLVAVPESPLRPTIASDDVTLDEVKHSKPLDLDE